VHASDFRDFQGLNGAQHQDSNLLLPGDPQAYHAIITLPVQSIVAKTGCAAAWWQFGCLLHALLAMALSLEASLAALGFKVSHWIRSCHKLPDKELTGGWLN
jgi:hypothetical protein